jgi:6,7-dimethyl-8-ribityllumazine synthase
MTERPHIMVVEARYYEDLSAELLRGATRALEAGEATFERFQVPGALEIPAAVRFAAESPGSRAQRRHFDGYVALGCVIRGETTHYDYVCGESARGLQDLAVKYTLALGYGILTVENEAQAWERARVDRKNKGGDAARACLAMIEAKRKFGLFPRT